MKNSKAVPGLLTYFLRGVGYALTSALALSAGYLIGTKNLSIDRFLFLLIPFFSSLFFFVVYAVCFQTDKKGVNSGTGLGKYVERESAKFSVIIGLLLSALIFLVHWIIYGYPGNLSLCSFTLYSVPFLGYGLFLYNRIRNSSEIIVRHQLVLPVILSISFPLYFGMHLEELTGSVLPLWPFGVIMLLSIISERLSLSFKIRTIFGLVVYFLILLLSISGIISNPYISPYLLKALFCIAIAAYLAVFESWGVTIGVANRNATNVSDISNIDAPALGPTSERYYQNTLCALIISGLSITLLYICSAYTTLFLIFFAIHATVALVLWYRAGACRSKLKRFKWGKWKLGFGFAFLSILVLDSRIQEHLVNSEWLPDFVSWSGVGYLIALVALFLSVLSIYGVILGRDSFIKRLQSLTGRRNKYIAIIPLASLALCTLVLIIKGAPISEIIIRKGHFAFILYSVFLIVSLVYLIIQFFASGKIPRSGLGSIVGLIILTRVFTSLAVGVVIFLPSIRGGFSGLDSLFFSIPFVLAASGGFAFNDYFDAARDTISKPLRAIPSGRLSRKTALTVACILLTLAAFSITVSSPGLFGSLIQCATVGGVLLYNCIVKKFAWAKGLFTSLLCVSPLVFDVYEFGYASIYWLMPVGTYMFIFGREIWMDMLDTVGDSATGLRTMPILIGVGWSNLLSLISMLIGCLIVVSLGLITRKPFDMFLSCAVLGTVLVLIVFWLVSSEHSRRNIIRLSWVPMLLGLAILL